MEEFDEVSILEKDGSGCIWINNNKIKSLTDYKIERGTDTANLTFSISIPNKNLKTIES